MGEAPIDPTSDTRRGSLPSDSDDVVLVTGASGFVGSHLVQRLADRGVAFRALVRNEAHVRSIQNLGGEAHLGDLTRRDSLTGILDRVNVVFHCAGMVDLWGAKSLFHAVNAEGLSNLLSECAPYRPRLIHLSSASVHREPLPSVITEDHPLTDSSHPYLASKVEAERHVMRAHHTGDVAATILRPVHIFGARSQLVKETVSRVRTGQRTLISFRSGTFPTIYVENLLDAMLLSAQRPEASGRSFLVTDDVDIDWNSFVRALARASRLTLNPKPLAPWLASGTGAVFEALYTLGRIGRRPPVTRAAVRMLSVSGRFSIEEARTVLGYYPRYGLEEALAETARWVQESW